MFSNDIELVKPRGPQRPPPQTLLLLLRQDFHHLPRHLPPPQVQALQSLPKVQKTQNYQALQEGQGLERQ